jgi:hypothetical protein
MKVRAMPLSIPITEEMVQNFSPDDSSWQKAKEIVREKRILNPGVSADGTWLIGEGKGSAKEPYSMSIDFVDINSPVFRSSSPSRKFPDKYSLALLLAYAQKPDSFSTREPADDLLAKREKKQAQDAKKAGAFPAAKKVNKAAQDKKIAAQREGLELLEKLLVDIVAAGQWFEESRLEKLERQAKQLNDSFLPATMHTLRKLILLGRNEEVSDEEKMAHASELIGQLWATVQKGRAYLDNKLSGEETQAEADAVMEEVLGKAWQLTELKEKGYFQSNLSLLELAYERTDDESRLQRIEISNLLDLNSGDVRQAIAYRPFKGLNQIPEQPSHMNPITVPEGAIYPGFLNRRVRWEKGSETEENSNKHLEQAYKLAKPDFKTAVEAFRAQLKHPLAPREAVIFVRCEKIGKVDDQVVLEDANGTRIEAVDRNKDYSNVSNLIRGAGMLGKDKPAVLLRLFVRPLTNTIVAIPLAMLTNKHQLRLGL